MFITSKKTEEALRARLCVQTDAEDVPSLFVYEEIDSTNTEAKRMCANGFEGRAIIAAEHQTAGRGRMGRSFYSPADTGAYFSILYTTQELLCDAVRITSAASVAVMRAIRTLTGKQTLIKWVNDLYLNEKKVAGILTEAVSHATSTHIIVGIGINLSTEDFPPELSQIAGALGSAELCATDVIAEVWRELKPFLNDPSNRSWLEDYRTYSTVLGREITWICEGREEYGIATSIDCDGALLVRRHDGSEARLSTGEISVRLKKQE